MNILLTIAFTVFIIYNCISISLFGIPRTLSETFYLYNGIKPRLGYIFTLMIFFVSISVLPSGIEYTQEPFKFVFFICTSLLAFVGAAPAFKGIDKNYHEFFAITSAIFGLSWIIFLTHYWYILFIYIVVSGAFMYFTNSFKSYIYWLELSILLTVCTILLGYETI